MKKLCMALCLSLVALLPLAAQQGVTKAQQWATFGAVSFLPPANWKALSGKQLSDFVANLGDRKASVLAVYMEPSERAWFLLTQGNSAGKKTSSDTLIRSMGAELRKRGFGTVEYADVETGNTVVPTLRAIEDKGTKVVMKSLVELKAGKYVTFDLLAARDSFNDLAPAVYLSLQSITVGGQVQ